MSEHRKPSQATYPLTPKEPSSGVYCSFCGAFRTIVGFRRNDVEIGFRCTYDKNPHEIQGLIMKTGDFIPPDATFYLDLTVTVK